MSGGRTVLACLGVLVCLIGTGCGGSSPPRSASASGSSGSSSAGSGLPVSEHKFLAGYVTSDGRVIRKDQGGDIVSEGQAYGMLVAELAGRPALARTIWTWTHRHLRGAHGLIASRATADGRIQDAHAAADADILTTYALLRYRGAGQDALHAQGRRLAGAVLAAESTTVGGKPVILAGPWAKSPPRVDPSYWMPGVFVALARYTGDDRWQQAAEEAVTLVAQVTDGGTRLPPDWAQLSGSTLEPIASPSGGAPVQYGLDAQRVPLWFATACSSRARELAAKWWQILSVNHAAHHLAVSLSGRPINEAHHPLPLLAGAAAAAAAGARNDSAALRDRAAEVGNAHPTYYGSAWLALGTALLDGTLDPCGES